MATPSIIKYPLDVSGTASSNRVTGEPITVPRGARSRAFALKAGPFFANSVVLTMAATGVLLNPGDDYRILYLYPDATAKVGQPISAVVWVTNPNIFGEVLADYQVLGGDYSSNASAITLLIETLALDERAVEWDDVLYKPVYYPPTPHLHNVRDWYGFDDVIAALDRISAALGGGGGGSTDLSAIYMRLDQIDLDTLALEQAVTLLNNQVAAAITNLTSAISELGVALVHLVGGQLTAKRTNLLMVTANFVLPNTTGLVIGTMVPLQRNQINITPVVSVFAPGTAQEPNETLRYRGRVGTAFNYITRNNLCAVLVAPKVWEITNDDD